MDLVHLPHGRLAIRDGDALLAVPTFHPTTPHSVRTQILELVLRRLVGEAYDLAAGTWDTRRDDGTAFDRLDALISERPHRPERRAA